MDDEPHKELHNEPHKKMDKRLLYIIIALVIIVVAVALIFFGIGSSGSSNLAAYDDLPVPNAVLNNMRIGNNVSSIVGMGVVSNSQKSITGPPLTLNGKPQILYVGSDFCPFCASERWPLIIALMRFGNFTGLKYMTSDANDYAPSTPTFTFFGSNYTSDYIAFVSVELSTNTRAALQSPNASQATILNTYNPSQAIPFVDFANTSLINGADLDPKSVLDGKNWSVIISNLHNASTPEALSILGAANLITARICKIDNNQPQSVCGQNYISRIEKNL